MARNIVQIAPALGWIAKYSKLGQPIEECRLSLWGLLVEVQDGGLSQTRVVGLFPPDGASVELQAADDPDILEPGESFSGYEYVGF